MEEELSKTSDGQDRLDRANDRLDTRVAEIGQAELDREENERKVDQAPVQEDNLEGSVEEAEGTAPMEQGAPISSTPRNAPEPKRFDMSPRGTSPKRKIGDDDMEDDSRDKRPRPRCPTISYRTDAHSVGSNMDGRAIDMHKDTDKNIFSASIMGVDIVEV